MYPINKAKLFSLPLLSTSLLTACIPDSINLPTGEMSAEIVVKVDEEATYVNAVLIHDEHGRMYTSNKEEKFTATLQAEEKQLTQDQSATYFDAGNFKLTLNSPINTKKSYSTKFEGNYEGANLSVTLDRAGKQKNTVSSIEIPQASLITLPSDGQLSTLVGSVDTTWAPSGLSDTVTLHFTSDCDLSGHAALHPLSPVRFPIDPVRHASFDVPDTGSYTASSVAIVDLDKYKVDESNGKYIDISSLTCTVKAYITRKSKGILGSEFNGGKVIAENTREMTGTFNVKADQPWKNYTVIPGQ